MGNAHVIRHLKTHHSVKLIFESLRSTLAVLQLASDYTAA